MAKRKTKEEFITQATELHKSKYVYSKVNYINAVTKVDIICPIHGIYRQTPSGHLRNRGCPKCGRSNKKQIVSDKKSFIKKAQSLHGDFYDYSKVVYENNKSKVIIICPDHGEFVQKAKTHLEGSKCKKCGKLGSRNTTEHFIQKANKVHNNFYDYSNTIYTISKNKLKIICPNHGEFSQRAGDHLSGSGCRKCSSNTSKPETELREFVESLGQNVIMNDRKLLKRYELDLLLPKLNLGIEYHGLEFHREGLINNRWGGKKKTYHKNKLDKTVEKNHKLIQIFEDEWLHQQEVVLKKLKHVISPNTNDITIKAKDCHIKKIDKATYSQFMYNNHLGEYGTSGNIYGLYYNNNIIASICFSDSILDRATILGYSKDLNYSVENWGSHMLKYYSVIANVNRFDISIDRRWGAFHRNSITKLGFVFQQIKPPTCRYVKTKKQDYIRYSKEDLISMGVFNNFTDHNFDRIWDSGHEIYTLTL